MFIKIKDFTLALLASVGVMVMIISVPDALRKFHKTVAPEAVRSVPYCTMVQIMRKGEVIKRARLCPGERFEFTVPPEPSI
jgi:hypothetical protein